MVPLYSELDPIDGYVPEQLGCEHEDNEDGHILLLDHLHSQAEEETAGGVEREVDEDERDGEGHLVVYDEEAGAQEEQERVPNQYFFVPVFGREVP